MPSRTDTLYRSAGNAFEVLVDGLQPDTRYYYRLSYRLASDTLYVQRDEHSYRV